MDSSLSSSAGKRAGSPGCVRSDVGHGGLPPSEASACREGALATVSGRDGGVHVGGEGTEGRMSIGGFGAAEVEKFERRLRQGGEPEELLANTANKGDAACLIVETSTCFLFCFVLTKSFFCFAFLSLSMRPNINGRCLL